MERHGEKIRYSTVNFLQVILSFLVNYLLSFPEHVKTIFHCLFHSKQDHGFTLIYRSLKTEIMSSSCTFNSDQDLSFESHDINDQPCEPYDTKVDTLFFPHDSVPYKIQNRYRPLQLPHVLHESPRKHYKYLPRFDGESDNLTTEKHLQAFEHFTDLL